MSEGVNEDMYMSDNLGGGCGWWVSRYVQIQIHAYMHT